MGRRKIQIAPIQDDRNRNVTFGKRRNGLFKKAYELGVLCSVDVAVMVWSHTGKLHVFSSQGSMGKILERYHKQSESYMEMLGPRNFTEKGFRRQLNNPAAAGEGASGAASTATQAKKRRRNDDDSDDDDDDDDGDLDEDDLLGPEVHLDSSKPNEGSSHNRGGGGPANGDNMHTDKGSHRQSPNSHQNQQNQINRAQPSPSLQSQHMNNNTIQNLLPYALPNPFFTGGFPPYPHGYPNFGHPGASNHPQAAAAAAAAAAAFYASPMSQAQAQARANAAAIQAAIYGGDVSLGPMGPSGSSSPSAHAITNNGPRSDPHQSGMNGMQQPQSDMFNRHGNESQGYARGAGGSSDNYSSAQRFTVPTYTPIRSPSSMSEDHGRANQGPGINYSSNNNLSAARSQSMHELDGLGPPRRTESPQSFVGGVGNVSGGRSESAAPLSTSNDPAASRRTDLRLSIPAREDRSSAQLEDSRQRQQQNGQNDRVPTPRRQGSGTSETGHAMSDATGPHAPSSQSIAARIAALQGYPNLEEQDSTPNRDEGSRNDQDGTAQGGHARQQDYSKHLMSATDMLLQLSSDSGLITSPSQLFPDIYKSMSHFAETEAIRAMELNGSNGDDQGDGNDQAHNEGFGVFKWPLLNSRSTATAAQENDSGRNTGS